MGNLQLLDCVAIVGLGGFSLWMFGVLVDRLLEKFTGRIWFKLVGALTFPGFAIFLVSACLCVVLQI